MATVRVRRFFGRERMWKLESTLTGMLCAMVAQRLIKAAYRSVRKGSSGPTTPFNPAEAGFSWERAVLWAAAGGIGLGIAKVTSARLAALGWQAATGTLPPDVEDRARG